MLNAGTILQNRYRIEDTLGQGGMGAVYRAEDMRLNVEVALKEMTPQPGLSSESLAGLRQQFRQEATILARLHHPALVNVTDFFEEDGNAYLVMNFVEGEHLAELIQREGAQPKSRVLTWAAELLDALQYCHDQGVLHRDIKPQNIVIGHRDHAVLVDFGLVKLWDPTDPHTKTVIRGVGSPEYAPPEQYSTQTEHTDPRSDLYSLAATLYHALTGEAPPSATERMAIPTIFTPLRQLNPEVPPNVEQAILRAMALPQHERFASAQEMLEALTQAPAAQPTTTPPPVVPQKTPEATALLPDTTSSSTKKPKKKLWWLVAVGGLLLLACCAGVGLVGNQALQAAFQPTSTATVTPPPPTATRPPRPTQAPTSTPRPSATAPELTTYAVQPVLLSPQEGSTHKNPVVFEWQGELSAGQVYIVNGINARTQYQITSPPLTTSTWATQIPAEAFGEWQWSVSVVRHNTTLATSEQGKFWFNEFHKE